MSIFPSVFYTYLIHNKSCRRSPLLFGLFLLLSIPPIVSQRVFLGEIITTENDTLRGEVWFGLSGEMPMKTKLVYFSKDGVKVQRFKPKNVASMTLVHDVTGEERYYEKKNDGTGDYLFSKERGRDIGASSGGGGAITFSGDTIFGKYVQFPKMIVPIKGVNGKEVQITAYWFNDEERRHLLVRKSTSRGETVFLEKITEGKLSHYQEVYRSYLEPGDDAGNGKTIKVYQWATVSMNYLCKEGIGCDKVPDFGFNKFIERFAGDCEAISRGYYEPSELGILVEAYNKQCGDNDNQTENKK